MTNRRWFVPAVLALLASGGVAFLATSRVWARGGVTADGLPADVVSVSGSAAFPLVGALSVVVVTAALAVLATGGVLRRAVGAVTVLAAIVALWVVARGNGTLDRAFFDAVEQSPAFTGQNSPDPDRQMWWPVVTMVAFCVAAGIGEVTAAVGHRWPTMGSRYERPTATAPVAPATEADIWKALDEGRDPTE